MEKGVQGNFHDMSMYFLTLGGLMYGGCGSWLHCGVEP